ncbi:hypothetical protein D0T11_01350 [Hymenobacter rubripertinctus]|uniref:Uncharacterized protein n=1 Tax=Hymenobacter rubripertinctus TaxID=2029981 RepID=A0A418R8Z1_9BACT|nr:hypothetical protein D0T11_01350 [Hymenobacter rubripertinctus]
MVLDTWGKFEAVILSIVEEELGGSCFPVAAAGLLALLTPVLDFLVVKSEVGQLVVGAGEGGGELFVGGQLRISKAYLGLALSAGCLAPEVVSRGRLRYPFSFWRNFFFGGCAWAIRRLRYCTAGRDVFVEHFRT